MLTTPALSRLCSINCPVGQKMMFLILDGNLVRGLILWLFKMMIKIIDMWMIMIPDIRLNFSFRGLRICGKVGIGSANQTGINIKNSKFTEEEERNRNGKCIYFAAASFARLWTFLQVSLEVPLAASNAAFFAAFLAFSLVSLVSPVSLVSLKIKIRLYIFARNLSICYINYSYQLDTRYLHKIWFWSNLLLLLLLQL